MKTFFRIAAIGFLLTLTACNSPIQGPTTVVNLPVIQPNLPQAPEVGTVTWKVYDAKDLQALSISNPNVILFTLTQDENQVLNDNIVELQRYILQLKQTVVYYQNATTPATK